MISLALGWATLVAAAWALFGNPFEPLFYVFRVGAPFPLWIMGASIFVGATTALLSYAGGRGARKFRLAISMAAFCLASVVSANVITSSIRSQKVTELSPDRVRLTTFAHSLRFAGREFQFDLHGAALKDCRPYAWSYKRMAFYELPPNIAVNVLSPDWIAECRIERTGR